jgi:hypothetical protein
MDIGGSVSLRVAPNEIHFERAHGEEIAKSYADMRKFDATKLLETVRTSPNLKWSLWDWICAATNEIGARIDLFIFGGRKFINNDTYASLIGWKARFFQNAVKSVVWNVRFEMNKTADESPSPLALELRSAAARDIGEKIGKKFPRITQRTCSLIANTFEQEVIDVSEVSKCIEAAAVNFGDDSDDVTVLDGLIAAAAGSKSSGMDGAVVRLRELRSQLTARTDKS